MQDKSAMYNLQYPKFNSTISITYLINQDVLHTQDRVNLYYVSDGQPGKELAQVIDGIDYGAEVRSIT